MFIMTSQAQERDVPSILPKPTSIKMGNSNSKFILSNDTKIVCKIEDKDIKFALNELNKIGKELFGKEFKKGSKIEGVNNIITYAMIGDTVDYLEWKTGERGEGICFAMQTLINKIGMAVGAFIGVMSMAIAGINARTYEVENPDALWTVLILSGVVSMFACAVPMFFYTITEKRQKEMVAEIAARKSK